MRTYLLFFAAFLFFNLLHSQTMRYFETIGLGLPAGEWRDSSYVVAASDSTLLAEIEYELTRPLEQRRHLNNPIAGGNGGFNHNAGFWFSWHSKPNEWSFAEFSVEVCDGRPYSDVEADTAYWIGHLGYYCGWSHRIAREISAPVSAPEPAGPPAEFLSVIPNPADPETVFHWSQAVELEVTLTVSDAQGRLSVTLPLGPQPAGQHAKSFATAALSGGVYFATLRIGQTILTQRFVVTH